MRVRWIFWLLNVIKASAITLRSKEHSTKRRDTEDTEGDLNMNKELQVEGLYLDNELFSIWQSFETFPVVIMVKKQ